MLICFQKQTTNGMLLAVDDKELKPLDEELAKLQ